MPAGTPRCSDSREKFRVHGTKYVVSQNMITYCCNRMGPFFSDPSILYTIVLFTWYLVEFKIHSAKSAVFQNMITVVLIYL